MNRATFTIIIGHHRMATHGPSIKKHPLSKRSSSPENVEGAPKRAGKVTKTKAMEHVESSRGSPADVISAQLIGAADGFVCSQVFHIKMLFSKA